MWPAPSKTPGSRVSLELPWLVTFTLVVKTVTPLCWGIKCILRDSTGRGLSGACPWFSPDVANLTVINDRWVFLVNHPPGVVLGTSTQVGTVIHHTLIGAWQQHSISKHRFFFSSKRGIFPLRWIINIINHTSGQLLPPNVSRKTFTIILLQKLMSKTRFRDWGLIKRTP